jgi:two-component system sensor histidine kinase PilS (NtrC family)
MRRSKAKGAIIAVKSTSKRHKTIHPNTMIPWLERLENHLASEVAQEGNGNTLHRRSLRLYLLYRITLSFALLFLFFSGSGPWFLGSANPKLYYLVATLYLSLNILTTLYFLWRPPSPLHQAYLALFVDVIAITLLMSASGGIATGMGMLIAVSITASASIMGGRAALLFAALAALFVLLDQIYASITLIYPSRFIQAGFLGTVYFATALLTLVFSSRARAIQKLAEARADQIEHMAEINAYVIEHMRTGVLVIDDTETILMMNDPAWHLLGLPSATTGSTLSKASPELALMFQKRRSSRRKHRRTFQIQGQGPEIRAHFTPLSGQGKGDMLIFLEDTSQITREAQQMKLASLGRLTASIAHEIRNPLGAISHASQLIDESPNLDKADKRLTEIITTNAERVNQVIENVLQLSRHDPGKPRFIPLKSWLQKLIVELVKHHGFQQQEILLQIEPENTEVVANPEQLRQIVTNLCNNAHEHCDVKQLQLQIVGGLTQEFNYPILDVVDNGPGIKPKVAKQIFEPFFTTRNTGTGLGLYIAKELSETNRIRLEYIPGPTGGSCFRLHFKHWQRRSRSA